MSMMNCSGFGVQNSHMQIGFGYKSVMKHVATDHHLHCAYGGEELNSRHPATAEHVKLHSRGGHDNDSNFLPVCQEHNGERANIPLPKFLATHPKAWENIKKSILELNGIKEGGFDGHKWAQNIVKVVENEAGRHMDIDLGDDVSSVEDLPERYEASNEEIDKTLTTRSGKKIYVGQKEKSENVDEKKDEDYSVLITKSGKEIHVSRHHKPLNLMA